METEEFLEIIKNRIDLEESYTKGMSEIASKLNNYREKYKRF